MVKVDEILTILLLRLHCLLGSLGGSKSILKRLAAAEDEMVEAPGASAATRDVRMMRSYERYMDRKKSLSTQP